MKQPNILFILIDDLGWRDLGCTGSTFYETPNLDRLATQGLRFTDAYAACPVCSPTQASLLTGKYPATMSAKHGTLPWRIRTLFATCMDGWWPGASRSVPGSRSRTLSGRAGNECFR